MSHAATTKTHPKLQTHFHSMDQQLEASTLGMWVFLVTEVMFFGGLFMAYIVYRHMYPLAWVEASHELNWKLGGLNTAVLICSSITMALAVRSAMMGDRKWQMRNIAITSILGATFLVVKFFEYKAKFEHHLVPGPNWDPHEQLANGQLVPIHLPEGAQIFFSLYFIMTGIHALHMVIGLGIMAYIWWQAKKGAYDAEYFAPVEVSGLYWHFVDIVWIFLFPLLYLLGAHGA